jgi:hypothetical protein
MCQSPAQDRPIRPNIGKPMALSEVASDESVVVANRPGILNNAQEPQIPDE